MTLGSVSSNDYASSSGRQYAACAPLTAQPDVSIGLPITYQKGTKGAGEGGEREGMEGGRLREVQPRSGRGDEGPGMAGVAPWVEGAVGP